jgi:spore coat protein H
MTIARMRATYLIASTMMARLIALLPLLCCARLFAANSVVGEPGADFFTNGAPHRFEVQLNPESLAALRTTPREYVPATVRADGQTYTNVGVHLKGVATFRPVDDQPSLTLNFSKFASKQRFHGLRKIHLNNGKEDPTFLCEAISAGMFAQSGLPVARVIHARVRLNGRDLGPYVVIEGFTPEFLGRYFKDTRGNLYDSGFRHDITHPLEKLSGKKPHDWADLKKLAAAASMPDLEQRWEQLGRTLDTNNFARYLAMQVLTCNWDGYAMYKNNYRVYHDPESDRLFFIPHGMDQMFARPFLPLIPPRWDGLVARSFMETPQGRTLYEQQLGRLFTNVYHTDALTRRVTELAERVRPMLADRNEQAAFEYDRLVAGLRRRIVQRGQFLAQQLAATNSTNPPQPR